MDGTFLAEIVRNNQGFLMKIVEDFTPEDADFRPVEEMMTTAQQIRHIALTLDWFLEGAFGAGFDLDFEQLEESLRQEVTLPEALQTLSSAFARFIKTFEEATPEALESPMADNPIFGPAPRHTIIGPALDHTAHHRGALAVYLRLRGKKPAMIYS